MLGLTLGALFAWQWCKRRRHNAEGKIRQIKLTSTLADEQARILPHQQAVLSLAKGIDSTSHSKSSGSIVPRVPPFKFPHRIVRAQERAMSVSPLFTGDGTVANRESALPIQVRDGRQLHFQSRLAPGHFAEHHAHCTALEATSPSPSLKSDKRSRLPICLYLFSKLYTGCFSYY